MALQSNFKSLSLTTPSGTDLWRKPPSTDSSNAPCSLHPPIPLSSFHAAQVTVSASWTRRYDQGGLVLLLPGHGWVKTGIEFENGGINVGTVATPSGGYSDWSLLPWIDPNATIRVEREKGGPSLLVYAVGGKEKVLIREVTWVFKDVDAGNVEVGVYLARPTKEDGDSDTEGLLSVSFMDFSLETTSA